MAMPRRPGPPDIPRLEPTDLKDTRWQRQRGLKPPLQTGIYRQLVEEGYEEQTSSPANDRYRDIMARQQERLDGPVSPRQKQLGDPMEAVGAVLEEGRRLGADIVGVCQVMPEHVFQGHETEVHPNAIVLAMAMDHDRLAAAPHQPAGEEVTLVYMELGEVCVQLAAWLRARGWPARAHHPRGDRYCECDLLYIPHAIAAGLGELGRHGSLLTPEFGPRVRLGMVTTTLPLEPSTPIDLGLATFCNHCQRCLDTCPAGAISTDRSLRRGSERWLVDTEACLPYFAAYDGCGICLARCVLNRPTTRETRELVDSITKRYGTPQWWHRE